MEDTIEIFEEAHPNKQALFIFNQLSAHASLPPDTLEAFKMNKSDGGKQWKQLDIVILMSNPSIEQCSKPQSMMLPDGQPKGLQTVGLLAVTVDSNSYDFNGIYMAISWTITASSNQVAEVLISALKSSPMDGKKTGLNQTWTGKDQTGSLVFWILRIKDCKKTNLNKLVWTG
jgi:hypothetical protein